MNERVEVQVNGISITITDEMVFLEDSGDEYLNISLEQAYAIAEKILAHVKPVSRFEIVV